MNVKSVLDLHSNGYTNREIAQLLGVSHSGIAYQLNKHGLIANGTTKQPLQLVDKDNAICNKCNQVKPLIDFRMQRSNSKYPYRLTYCNPCRTQQQVINLNSSISVYIANRCNALKLRATKSKIPFSITKEYLLNLFTIQNGKCFYTDTVLRCEVGNGYSPNAFSVDKIIPELGYIENNVVLCTVQVNTVKSNLTLEQIKDWMPGWYARIKSLLPNL